MPKKIKRRDFLKTSGQIGATAVFGGSVLPSLTSCTQKTENPPPDISVVTGANYFDNTMQAVSQLGGMKKFIPKNARVAILPNAQSKNPGTYTNPDVVRAVIQMCKKAGAQEINCLTWLPMKFWSENPLKEAVEQEGANLVLAGQEEQFFQPVEILQGKALKSAQVMKELFNNDVLIDIPVTKDHAGNKFTGTMKNLMGLNSPQCNRTFHKDNWDTDRNALMHLDQCIADLNTVIKPDLCVVDATEFIITNGPFGPGKILRPQKVVAGVDRIAIDSYCAGLWDLNPEDIIMIKQGYAQGLGEMDLQQLRIKEIAI
jgi:uncharacterized protein (DUF362 family)